MLFARFGTQLKWAFCLTLKKFIMKLYRFYKEDEKQVFGTFAEGKNQFFFSGFKSADEAKQTTIKAHVAHRLEKIKPNSQGIKPPTSLITAEVEMVFDGVWSEIE